MANLCLSRRSVRCLVECWGREVIGVFWRKRKRRIRGFLEKIEMNNLRIRIKEIVLLVFLEKEK